MPDRYRRLVFRVEGDTGILIARLWELGTLGVELLDNGDVIAYFDSEATLAEVDWRAFGARLGSDELHEQEDWMAAYRAASQPLPIGTRLVIDPREPALSETEVENWPGRELLRLPARTAFGTGSHASTRLVLELLEEMDVEGKRVLDVGFGTGILSFAALLGGAARVVGVEIDLASALVAEQNRDFNGLYPSWIAGTVSALEAPGAFDLALVNVLPERIRCDLATIRRLLATGGSAVFSGISVERAGRVGADLERVGFRLSERRARDAWAALLVR